MEPIERFLSKVDKTGECWIWMGARKPKGYGNFYLDGRYLNAHRASYELHKGYIPDGMVVCHSCDVPFCVNPEHLWLGTSGMNTKDMIEKGRDRLTGQRHHSSKLVEEDVAKIREMRNMGMKLREIASCFGICEANVSLICNGKAWK